MSCCQRMLFVLRSLVTISLERLLQQKSLLQSQTQAGELMERLRAQGMAMNRMPSGQAPGMDRMPSGQAHGSEGA